MTEIAVRVSRTNYNRNIELETLVRTRTKLEMCHNLTCMLHEWVSEQTGSHDPIGTAIQRNKGEQLRSLRYVSFSTVGRDRNRAETNMKIRPKHSALLQHLSPNYWTSLSSEQNSVKIAFFMFRFRFRFAMFRTSCDVIASFPQVSWISWQLWRNIWRAGHRVLLWVK